MHSMEYGAAAGSRKLLGSKYKRPRTLWIFQSHFNTARRPPPPPRHQIVSNNQCLDARHQKFYSITDGGGFLGNVCRRLKMNYGAELIVGGEESPFPPNPRTIDNGALRLSFRTSLNIYHHLQWLPSWLITHRPLALIGLPLLIIRNRRRAAK